MSLRVRLTTGFVAVVILFAWMARRPGATSTAAEGLENTPSAANAPDIVSTPVLVELFTSEGCSTCPPADALLSRLGRTQPVPGAEIIVLEEHVDYWDRLGWKDPFSSAAATARQNEYDQTFAGGQAYTPQMVVDGRAKFVGSSDSDALRAIRTAIQTQKTAIHVSWEPNDTLGIRVEPLTDAGTGDSPQLYLAVTESMVHSDVKHGENAGRSLQHDGVVRQLLSLAKIETASSGFSSSVAVHPSGEWNRANLRAVVFVQDRRSLHILAATAVPFPKV